MTLGELLDAIRDQYLGQFRARLGPGWLAETAYRLEHGELAREGPLKLPLRLDLVEMTEAGGKPATVDAETILNFEPFEVEWAGGLNVRVEPFVWDACSVGCAGLPAVPDWKHLTDWFEHWFDPEDIRSPGPDGLSGVVHFLSEPQPDGNAFRFQVDFGSASVEAFEELLDALRDSGAAQVQIGSV